MDMSTERVHVELGMSKLRLLNADQRCERVEISKDNPCHRRFVTVDEIWLHYYIPKTKQ